MYNTECQPIVTFVNYFVDNSILFYLRNFFFAKIFSFLRHKRLTKAFVIIIILGGRREYAIIEYFLLFIYIYIFILFLFYILYLIIHIKINNK